MSNPVDIRWPNDEGKKIVAALVRNPNLANNQMRMKSSYQQKRLKIIFKAILKYF